MRAVSLFQAAQQLKVCCAAIPRTPCCPGGSNLRPPARRTVRCGAARASAAIGPVGGDGAQAARGAASRGGCASCAASVRAPPRRTRARRALAFSRRAHHPAWRCKPRRLRQLCSLCECRACDPLGRCRRSSRLYVTGKAVPSTPEVHAWALLMLLGLGNGRGGLPRVREWVSVVLQQRVCCKL